MKPDYLIIIFIYCYYLHQRLLGWIIPSVFIRDHSVGRALAALVNTSPVRILIWTFSTHLEIFSIDNTNYIFKLSWFYWIFPSSIPWYYVIVTEKKYTHDLANHSFSKNSSELNPAILPAQLLKCSPNNLLREFVGS